MAERRTARAPGRVNLIGDHTDYTGGLVMPMAIDRATTVRAIVNPVREVVRLESSAEAAHAVVDLSVEDVRAVQPPWARFVAALVAEMRPEVGSVGKLDSDVPVGVGLSSSAALLVATALALGADIDDPFALAQLCQRAEQRATGVPVGIMDPLASLLGVEGAALVIDCSTLNVIPVAMPPIDTIEIRVVHSGHSRSLMDSAYEERVAQCTIAEDEIGASLATANLDDLSRITSDLVRRRARHVITENERVRGFAIALLEGDLVAAGTAMNESHASLRDDFDVSTDALDRLQSRLVQTAGVFGARLTGAGFGGCVVALARPGALEEGWAVRASDGASVALG